MAYGAMWIGVPTGTSRQISSICALVTAMQPSVPVSYTHLDVYKRQPQERGLDPQSTDSGVRYWIFPEDYDQRVAAILAQPATAKH